MRRWPRGQSMTEFIIVTPIMLLLVFGALQFAFIYHAKTLLNYAAFEAARFGAVSNARKTEMENAFARAMAAIYTHDDTKEDVMCAREIVRREIATGFVNIEIINPPPDAFTELGVDDGSGDKLIPNDNLMFRNNTTTAGLTIQDANLLKIRVGYCYPMYVPYINRVLGIILTNDDDPATCPYCRGVVDAGTFEHFCLQNGRFPINAQAIVRMQSAASLDASTSSSAPATLTGTSTPFNQCDTSSFTVTDSLTPEDTTTKTGFWTLSKQTGP